MALLCSLILLPNFSFACLKKGKKIKIKISGLKINGYSLFAKHNNMEIAMHTTVLTSVLLPMC